MLGLREKRNGHLNRVLLQVLDAVQPRMHLILLWSREAVFLYFRKKNLLAKWTTSTVLVLVYIN